MKKAFDLDAVLDLVEQAVAPFPKAAMFQLYAEGFITVFEQLISCIVSIRTLDEVTIPVSKRLFSKARTPEQLAKLTREELAELLHGCTFAWQKAETMLSIAKTAVEHHGGQLPADYRTLTAFKGVGPKCANLALGIAAGFAAISVDIHVHRVVNRWGFISTAQPEQTLAALEQKVPKARWIDLNRLLMPFGKHLCTGKLPHCSTCPVLKYCRQVGVTSHR